jgi:hypothetical protein
MIDELKRPMGEIVADYTAKVNADPFLKSYRDWIEANAFGFGERCFLWMWKRIVDEMPEDFTFLEIGVFRGQILAIVEYLATRSGKYVDRCGVTPLDSSDGHWESDYAADIRRLHYAFGIPNDWNLFKGSSTDPAVIGLVQSTDRDQCFDIVYIDGGHAYDVVRSDIEHYSPLVKPGGYLVIDDCNNRLDMPDGYFRGIESVSKAVDEVFPPFTPNDDWEYIGSVVHNRILRRR